MHKEEENRMSKIKIDGSLFRRAIQEQTENLLDPAEVAKKEKEIRDLYFTANKMVKSFHTGVLQGLFGDEVGEGLARIFAKEDPAKVKEAREFFEQFEVKKSQSNVNVKIKVSEEEKPEVAAATNTDAENKVSPKVNSKRKKRTSRLRTKSSRFRDPFLGEYSLEDIIEKETKDILDPQVAFNKEKDLRDKFFTADKKTKSVQTGILQGLFGDEVGEGLARIFAKEDPTKIQEAKDFFKNYGKDQAVEEQKVKREQATEDDDSKENMLILSSDVASALAQKKSEAKVSLINTKSSSDESKSQEKKVDKLGDLISADENPLILLREKVDELVKSVGIDLNKKTVHEKLDELASKIDNGDSGSDLFDLLGLLGVGKRNRPSPRTPGMRNRPSPNPGGGNQRSTGGRIGIKNILAGGAGALAGGYIASEAVNAFRDKDLTQYDPEVLKQETIVARETGDTEYAETVKNQISAQKKDVALQAAGEVASVGGAVGGAYLGNKAVEKIGNMRSVRRTSAVISRRTAPVVRAVKNKTWDLFVKFVQARAPKLAAKIGTKLAAAGALATIPVAGWIAAIISLGFAINTAYDLYELWKQFSALSDAEKEAAASGESKPTKEVNDWAYSVFIGKNEIDDVPDEYREQVEEILKNPPANWKKSEKSGTPSAAPAAPDAGTPAAPAAPAAPATTTVTMKSPEVIASKESSQKGGFFSRIGQTITETGTKIKEKFKSFFGLEEEAPAASDLGKYVTLNGKVDLNGLNPKMKERLSGMSKEYYEKTGKKLQINSAISIVF